MSGATPPITLPAIPYTRFIEIEDILIEMAKVYRKQAREFLVSVTPDGDPDLFKRSKGMHMIDEAIRLEFMLAKLEISIDPCDEEDKKGNH